MKIMQIASNIAFETVYYNVHGVEHNPRVHLPNNGQMTANLRNFFFKNESMRAFMKGADKREERLIVQGMITSEVEDLEIVVHKGQMDRCLMFLSGGTLIRCNDQGPNEVLTIGTILGVE